MTEREDIGGFDAFYGKGMRALVTGIMNDLAPISRRDEWWMSEAPYDIIATRLMRVSGENEGTSK